MLLTVGDFSSLWSKYLVCFCSCCSNLLFVISSVNASELKLLHCCQGSQEAGMVVKSRKGEKIAGWSNVSLEHRFCGAPGAVKCRLLWNSLGCSF